MTVSLLQYFSTFISPINSITTVTEDMSEYRFWLQWVHPTLTKHERDIDLMLEQAKSESYNQVGFGYFQ